MSGLWKGESLISEPGRVSWAAPCGGDAGDARKRAEEQATGGAMEDASGAIVLRRRADRSPQSPAPAQATPGNAHIRETCPGVRRRRNRVEGKMAAAAAAYRC